MNDLFHKLYTSFLKEKIDPESFRGFKDSLNRLPDEELSDEMETYWMNNKDYPPLEIRRKQRIRKNIRKQIRPSDKRFFTPKLRLTGVAAIIALLSLSVWNIISVKTASPEDIFMAEVPAKNRVYLTLPDKSNVKLNSESLLSYHYEKGKRIAELKGEAYFEIARNERYPFIVHVGKLNIEVLGTSFNVSSYNESDFIETTLIEGSIRLYDSENPTETYTLKPSQKAIYSKTDGKINLQETDKVKETAWTHNALVFESEKLSTVFKRIERWYGVKIELLCPEIANDLITGSFKDEQLPYVMEALKMQYGFNYTISGNKVTINKSNN